MLHCSISPIEFVRILFSLLLLLLLFLSVWILGPWYLKNRINNHVQIFTVSLSLSGLDRYKLFSVITQPWRHLGAILCFDVIIDIFISVYHKLTKFNTHKLQVIRQHTDNPCPRARHDAHVRARQNFNMLKITYKQFWARTRSFRAFPNFPSVRVRARVVRARSANEWQKFKIFTWFGFLIQQLTISIDFQSLLTFHKAVRARQSLKSARAAMGNIMQKLAKTFHFWNWNSSRTNQKNQFLYHGWKEHELEIRFHTTLTRTKWNKVIILASKLEKMYFFDDVIFVFVQLRLSRLPIIDFLPDFDML